MRGCKNEMNLETFTDLAREFYFATIPDGYDAFICTAGKHRIKS
jgi:hypothetical protein